MAFVDSIMNQERVVAGESPMGANAALPSVIAGDFGEAGKRARVSGWGLEEGSNLKRVKPDFVLPCGFPYPHPNQTIYAPTPLSMRQPAASTPVAPFSMRHSAAPYQAEPFSMRHPAASFPAVPLSMRHSAPQPPLVPLSMQQPSAPFSLRKTEAPPISVQHPSVPPLSVQQPTAPSPSVQQPAAPPLSVQHPTSPLSVVPPAAHSPPQPSMSASSAPETYSCRQFWKAGEYVGPADNYSSFSGGIDHVRVHPKFLHSNATSHKWALGALAELLDNSFDEVCNGATFVSVDVLENPTHRTKMLLIEDDGGGMDPDKIRHCMSLGYSMKSKSANTIGQYGNGFKTSTMRLGADVIVFSRCKGKNGMSPTQGIGMLSYTFLRNTGKQDIIVPMLDYEKRGDLWSKMERSSSDAWNTNMDSLVQWSPYSSEAALLQQFDSMSDQGTRIIIYNLWEDDEGQLELDFVSDVHDIQIRGANRDEKKIEMANNFPNSRHFLTYRHSLRSYASILYLRLPQGFRMILRGKEIEHHNIVNDMMMKQEMTYRPQSCPDGFLKDSNIYAVVTIGFVKDATSHIDVQGFNVYHKNRLIKPFWRVWNAAGSDGRGVIGVLEANFVEPAHDKQGFERTTVLNRLETRLLHIQKTYWSSNCQEIGYAPRRQKKSTCNSDKECSPKTQLLQTATMKTKAPYFLQSQSSQTSHQQPETTIVKTTPDFLQPQSSNKHQDSCKLSVLSNHDATGSCILLKSDELRGHGSVSSSKIPQKNDLEKSGELLSSEGPRDHFSISSSDHHGFGKESMPSKITRDECCEAASPYLISPLFNHGVCQNHASDERELKNKPFFGSSSMENSADCNANGLEPQDSGQNKLLAEEKRVLSKLVHVLQIERKRNKELTEKVELLEKRLADSDKEQEKLIDVFSEERQRRDAEEKKLSNQLKDANDTIKKLKLATNGIIEL